MIFLLSLILAPAFVGLIVAHKIVAGVLVWAVFSAIVDGMPTPAADSGIAYRWLHASLNVLAGNLFRVLSVLSPRFGALFKAS